MHDFHVLMGVFIYCFVFYQVDEMCVLLYQCKFRLYFFVVAYSH